MSANASFERPKKLYMNLWFEFEHLKSRVILCLTAKLGHIKGGKHAYDQCLEIT